jgi:hypothetical protein
MELFDIIKAFTRPEEWAKVTNTEKAKNFFMINRMMSIRFPMQANGFNHTKIEPARAVDWWKEMIASKYNSTDKPASFVWTKTKKKEKEKIKPIPEEILTFICEKHEISMREIEDLKQFFPQEFQKYCDSVKEMLS